MVKILPAVIISILMLWVMGCQEQETLNARKARLIVVENKKLQAQLEDETKKSDTEIKNLKKQLQVDAQKRDDEIKSLSERLQAEVERGDAENRNLKSQLDECRKNTDEKIEEDTKKFCGESIANLQEWISELQKENAQFKAKLGIKDENE